MNHLSPHDLRGSMAVYLLCNATHRPILQKSTKDEKDQFYSGLKSLIEHVPTHDVLVVMGDLNSIT